MTGWRERIKRLGSRAGAGLLTLALAVAIVTAAGAASYMQPYLDKVVEWGIMRGDIEGNLNENNSITRAEFATMINRAFGYTQLGTGVTPFRDVAPSAWYAQDVCIAYQIGYMAGTSATTFSPNSKVTREQAAVILSRILMLQPEVGENTIFTDGRTMADWSRGYITSAARYGVIGGYPDGSFGPADSLTRGQAAILLVNALGTPLQKAGDYTLGNVWGNVTITDSNITLRNTVIGGNLYITDGVDLGHVTLENVTVLGDIVVSGGGVSESGEDSIIFRNVSASRMIVDNTSNHFLSLKVEGNGLIDEACVRTNAYLNDSCADGKGIAKISLDGEDGLSLLLSGNIKEVINYSPKSKLSLANGQADTITVDEKAVGSTLDIAASTRVENVNLDAGIQVTGSGDIANLTVNAAGSTVSMLPDQITIRPGITANINGQNMDSAAAAESSADPRLYAGYPYVKDLAPTSVTAVFSANKQGTIYWAVTAVTDGSVSAEDLIHPSSYAPKIVKSGTVNLTGAGKEGTAKISGLTSDGSYYLSTVFVDARDKRSPLKVISFSTPDNTKPDFASGYPYMSSITHNSAQTTVMTTKTCRLYWAVLPKGSTAPTAEDFKSNAVTGNRGFGTIDVLKNTTYPIDVNNVPLNELESYDLYLWLTDVDGAQSSAVKKLTFTTVDGTPPHFNVEPTVNSVKETAVGLYANLDEAGTLYWVIVKEGTVYPKPLAGQSGEVDLASQEAKLQVMAGMNALKSGKVSMTKDKDVSFNISGLEKESAYDLYYVAQDKAGNYSARVGKITIHTLDNTAPTVTQEFTKYNGTDTTKPLPESDVRLVFSEAVQTVGTYTPLADLYQKVTDAESESEKEAARTALGNALSNAIYLYQHPADSQPVRIESASDADKQSGNWVIDYRYAEIALEDGKTVITLPNGQAINLKSGATYYFEIQADSLADTSTAVNVMGRTPLDPFTTVFAVVNLSALNENSISSYLDTNNTPQTPADPILVDLSWRLSPVSTEKVDGSIDWDMLVWTDTSVEFQLYFREVGSATGTWKLLNATPVVITVPDNVTGYQGVSLTRNFLQSGNNPDFDALNTLKEDVAYEYAISFTKVAGLPDRGTWSQRINLRVYVAAGSNNDLSTLSADVTEENWTEALKRSVTDIGQPQNFSMRKQFTDQQAPTFIGDHPTFQAGDSAVSMSLMLDRPGTIYYVIAPLGYVGTTDDKGNVYKNDTNESGGPGQGTINWGTLLPDSGKNDDIDNETAPNPPKLVAPDYLNIVNASSNYRNDKIKYGSVTCGSSVEVELVEGLDPQEKYIAYFVLQGTSQSYSRVLAYRFETTDVAVPYITLEAVNPSVSFTTTQDANLNYALFAPNQLPEIFEKEMTGDKLADEYQKDDEAGKEEQPPKNSDGSIMTVLEAMLQTCDQATKMSYFDKYASQDLKDQVQEIIQRRQTGGGTPVASGQMTTKLNVAQEKDFRDAMQSEDNATSFYCLATAQNVLGSGYGFKAVDNVHIPDNEPPYLVDISWTFDQDSSNPASGKYSGTLTLRFNEPLYYMDYADNGTTADKSTLRPIYQSSPGNTKTYISVLDAAGKPTGYSVENSLWMPTREFTLKFTNINIGSTFTLSSVGLISDAAMNATKDAFSVKLVKGNTGAGDFLSSAYFEVTGGDYRPGK